MNAVLIVEGFGDEAAVPELVRKVLNANGYFDFTVQPRPIRVGDLPKILRTGELEKYVEFAGRRPNTDSVIVVLDCDDMCPVEAVTSMRTRIREVAERMRISVEFILMKKEFESLFLASFTTIVSECNEYEWSDHTTFENPEEIRGAKEAISKRMRRNGYKETRDQVKLLKGLDFNLLRARSRSFRQFEKALLRVAQGTGCNPINLDC